MNSLKKSCLFIFMALSMAVAIYLTFDKLLMKGMPEYAINISAAFLSALITVIITAILLNAQSLSELCREKSASVFNAKLELYLEFLDFINAIIFDGNIDKEEIKKLRGWALRLSLVCGRKATSTIEYFIDQTLTVQSFRWTDLSIKQREVWIEWWKNRNRKGKKLHLINIEDNNNIDFFTVGQILMELKIDLGEENISNLNEAKNNKVIIDSMLKGVLYNKDN